MLIEALEFPLESDDWLQTVLIGGVLSLLSFLIVPGILVNGYLLRVVRAGVQGDETPPKFGDWVDLLVDGVLVWVIQFVYAAVPTFLLFVVGGSFAVVTDVSSSSGPESMAAPEGAFVGVLVGLFLLILVLAAVYLLPAAIANFARTGEFTDAFALRTVAAGAASTDYLVALVLVIGVSIVLGVIGSLLTIVLVGVFVLFYLQMVVYHLFGQGFAGGLGGEGAGETTSEPAA